MKKIIVSLVGFLSVATMVTAQTDLYVDDASYMYVQDEVVFVTDGVRLENGSDLIGTGSHIYLRDGAQLLQDNNVKNSNEGKLSVYQSSTKGIYAYNYWGSPVGLGNTGQGDVDFVFANLYRPNTSKLTAYSSANDNTTSTAYAAVGGYNSGASNIANYWLWQVVNQTNYNQWQQLSTMDATVSSGQGFTMKGRPASDANKTIDFRGRPNTGDILVSCANSNLVVVHQDHTAQIALGMSPTGNGHYVESLLGNPYPSSLDLKLLFRNAANTANKNTFIKEAVYFYQDASTTHQLQGYQAGYGVWSPGTLNNFSDHGNFVPATFVMYDALGAQVTSGGGTGAAYGGTFNRRYAAIGQGFIVRTKDDNAGGNVLINNEMRVYLPLEPLTPVDVFEKSATPSPGTERLIGMSHNGLDYDDILNNPTIIPEIRIWTGIKDTYFRESLIAFRNQTDYSAFQSGTDADAPALLKTDAFIHLGDHKLAIKSIEFDVDARLPFTLLAGETDNSEFKINVNSIKDTPAGMEVFLYDNVTDAYTDILNGEFIITLDKGVYNDRFEITFRNSSAEDAALGIEEGEIANSFTVFQNNSAGSLMIKNPESYNVKAFTMYDVTGKLIYNKANLGTKSEYSFPTNSLSTGTYLVKVITKNNVEITKKVIVHNN